MKNLLLPSKATDKEKTKKKLKKISNKNIDKMDRLNEYSKAYIKNDRGFNDIDNIEIKLVELNELIMKSEAALKPDIQKIIDKYQLQQKQLIKERAVFKARNRNNDSNTVYRITNKYHSEYN